MQRIFQKHYPFLSLNTYTHEQKSTQFCLALLRMFNLIQEVNNTNKYNEFKLKTNILCGNILEEFTCKKNFWKYMQNLTILKQPPYEAKLFAAINQY